MDSSKRKDSSNTVFADPNSENNDEEKEDLCPGFKDADAFVKVSELSTLHAQFVSPG